MKNFFNFFFSFDKLMKDKLVPAFYWAALIFLAIVFSRNFLDKTIVFSFLASITGPLEFIARLVMAFVGLRLACELAIAVFRINDNLSPDGGKSETADIDPLAEARKAAEDAARKAREATSKAVDKTKSAASNLKDSSTKTTSKAGKKAEDIVETADDVIEEAAEKVKTTAKKVATPKKQTTRKTAAKKTTTSTPKKTTARTSTTKKTTAKKATTKKPPTKK